MKNRNCPNKDMCWDYNASRCEGCAVGEKIARIAHQNKKLKAENAELKSSLTHANEECLKWHERAQNLLKDSGGSISGYEKKISDLQAKNAELRHRLEVAERALLFLCDNTMSDGSIMIFPSTKTQVRNNQELYDYCIKQAEKELAEEKNEQV